MKKNLKMCSALLMVISFFICLSTYAYGAKKQPPTAPASPDRTTSFKSYLAGSLNELAGFEWVETTTVSLDGKEKSKTQMRCYYGDDGKLQKLPVSQSDQPGRKSILPVGRVINKMEEDKKRKFKETIEETMDAVKKYFPVTPARFQAAKDAKNVSFITKSAATGLLVINNYLKKNDSLSFDVNLANNRPTSLIISTYVDASKEPISLKASYGTLVEGTTYVSKMTVERKQKKIKVVVENTGYRKIEK
ncbi:MAG: hypothetical protein LWY06_15285 [Firmicutes bacterium]|nr:hypothetical protein [Bacillota bacterium]